MRKRSQQNPRVQGLWTLQDGGMAVRDRMTPSHQSVEHVRRVVREAQHKVVGGPAPPISDFNEEADDCYMADEHEISVRPPPLLLA